MRIGSPGGHIGTIASAREGDGRCPAGVNVHAARGQGADAASGCSMCVVKREKRRASFM